MATLCAQHAHRESMEILAMHFELCLLLEQGKPNFEASPPTSMQFPGETEVEKAEVTTAEDNGTSGGQHKSESVKRHTIRSITTILAEFKEDAKRRAPVIGRGRPITRTPETIRSTPINPY